MSNLFQFNILRPVQLLTPDVQGNIVTSTHQDGTTSAWFDALLELCKLRDHAAMYAMAMAYLNGQVALQTYDQLDPLLVTAIDFLRKKGKKAEAADLMILLPPSSLNTYFGSNAATTNRQDIEDTMLALAIINKLGNKRNLNYQLAHKAYQMMLTMSRANGRIENYQMAAIWAKPITLPTCVYNACTKKYTVGEPFPHLELNQAPEGGQTRSNCDCGCIPSTKCNDQNTCCAELRFFVSDLMELREDLACYEPKHIAYIENVMAGEERERIHRNLERTETFTETETETTRSQEKDHTVEDQFSLKSAVQKTIQEDLGVAAGVEFTGEFGTTKFTTHFDVSYDLAKSESSQIAQEYARNVTTRAVSKVEEKVRELKSTRQLKETEETNTHIFKNTSTTDHIIGHYFFVNMKNRAQVMNYGKRMMMEIIVPEPMEMYKRLLEKDVLPSNLEEPVRPTFLPHEILETASNNPLSYSYLIDKWGLTGVEPLPDPDIRIPFSFEDATKKVGENEVAVINVKVGMVPKGYNGRGIKVHAKAYDVFGAIVLTPGADPNDGLTQLQFTLSVDGLSTVVNTVGLIGETTWEPAGFDATQDSMVTLSIMAKSIVGIVGSGYLFCLLSGQAKDAWRIAIYEKVMAAYQRQLEEYNTAKARYQQEKNAKIPFGRNPFLNRDIERTELKRLAISYISCQFYDRFTAMKRNMKPCGLPEMDLEQAQRDGAFIQFFEQTFEWSLMNYLFYPYFWGQKCSWAEKVQQVSNDPLFDKALSAGAARIQVPVRLGHELLALYWSYFGEIWLGADQPPVAGSPYYVSMIQEIKEQKSCFYVDRPGRISAAPGDDFVILNYATATIAEYDNDPTLRDADIDREIMINCEVYRITAIESVTPSVSTDFSAWKISLDREYKGEGCCGCGKPEAEDDLKFRTGALFVGGPFEVVVPTNLVTLRNPITSCLPCYPLDDCQ